MKNMINGFPRRLQLDHLTDTETSIKEAMDLVDSLGADPRLTKAVLLLDEACNCVADFVEDNSDDFVVGDSQEGGAVVQDIDND